MKINKNTMPPENKSQNAEQVHINIKKSILIILLLFLCFAVYWYVYSLSFDQALVAGAGFSIFFNIVLFGLMIYLAFTYKSPHSKLRHVWGDDLLKIIGINHSPEPTIQNSRRNIIISISLLGVNMLVLAIIGYYGWYQLKASGAVIDNDRCKVFFDQSKPEGGDEFKLPVICTFDIGKDFKNWLFTVSEKVETDTEPSMYEIEIKNKKRDVVQTIRIGQQGSFKDGFLNMAYDINFDGYKDILLRVLSPRVAEFTYYIYNPEKEMFENQENTIEDFYGTDFCVTPSSSCKFYKGTIGEAEAYLVYDLDGQITTENWTYFNGLYFYEGLNYVKELNIRFSSGGRFEALDAPHGPSFSSERYGVNESCDGNSQVLCGTFKGDLNKQTQESPFYFMDTEPFNIFLQNR